LKILNGRFSIVALLLILLLAFALRTHRLTEIPPGLTHDEANHGWDSINILDGELRYYFPLNYGSEPLYNYIVAGNMALVGENLFALRLVNIFFGLLTIVTVYR
jgi:predicted membrane-bound mannosyltransferase